MTTPNPIWDCIAEIWFNGKVVRPHLKRVGLVVRDFGELEATPEEIKKRKARYEREWPKVDCTPEALVKHWCRFDGAKSGVSEGEFLLKQTNKYLQRQREHDAEVLRERAAKGKP